MKVNDGSHLQSITLFAYFDPTLAADEGELKMSVEYNGSTVAAMDMDSKVGYKLFSEGGKFQYSGKETHTHVAF